MTRKRTSEKTDQEILQGKRTFMLDYSTYKGIADILNLEQKGILLDIIAEYGTNNLINVNELLSELIEKADINNDIEIQSIKLAWSIIKNTIDRNNEQYIKKCRANSNIKQGADQERKNRNNE